jgi:hypothetical protein
MELIGKVRKANLLTAPDDWLSMHSTKGSADKCTRIQKKPVWPVYGFAHWTPVPDAIINPFMKPLDIQ